VKVDTRNLFFFRKQKSENVLWEKIEHAFLANNRLKNRDTEFIILLKTKKRKCVMDQFSRMSFFRNQTPKKGKR